MRPTKTQISLRIRAVWSESSFLHEESLHPRLTNICQGKILIRLCECTGWSESSLGAHFRMYVLWRCGSDVINLHTVCLSWSYSCGSYQKVCCNICSHLSNRIYYIFINSDNKINIIVRTYSQHLPWVYFISRYICTWRSECSILQGGRSLK